MIVCRWSYLDRVGREKGKLSLFQLRLLYFDLIPVTEGNFWAPYTWITTIFAFILFSYLILAYLDKFLFFRRWWHRRGVSSVHDIPILLLEKVYVLLIQWVIVLVEHYSLVDAFNYNFIVLLVLKALWAVISQPLYSLTYLMVCLAVCSSSRKHSYSWNSLFTNISRHRNFVPV